jgi:hypothetical protein
VYVTLHNGSATPITDVNLSWWAVDTTLALTLDDRPVPAIGPTAEFVWTLPVRSVDDVSPRAGQVFIRADYRTQVDPDAMPIAHHVLIPITVALRELEPMEKVAAVEVQTNVSTLKDKRPADFYLVVTNRLARPLDVYQPGYVTPMRGDHDCVTVTQDPRFAGGKAVTIPPGESDVIKGQLEASTLGVTPGEYRIVATLPWSGNPNPWPRVVGAAT